MPGRDKEHPGRAEGALGKGADVQGVTLFWAGKCLDFVGAVLQEALPGRPTYGHRRSRLRTTII